MFARVIGTSSSDVKDSWFFRDMEAAADRIAAAVAKDERIVVWGDYDVDGATSSALLKRFLAACGVEAGIYVPDRILEGYGPNAAGLQMLREEGADLVVVVDSGTVAFEPLEAARAAGLDVVVVDHHAPEATLPRARAIVNPNRHDQDPGYGMLCAAGVSFLLCVGLLRRLRATGAFANRPEPDLMELVDLVALGTVCDVVPLVGLNRAFVATGLKVMARRENLGIRTLSKVAGLMRGHQAYDCGFILGPRINAGGRIGQSDAGAVLLSSDDPERCEVLAKALDLWNRERQEMEKEIVAQAREMIEGAGGPDGFAMAASPGWHEGVIGIVASRLKEAYDLPAFCFSIAGGVAKGSGRGVPGFHLGNAVIAAKERGLLLKGGGHAMAAGVSLAADKLPEFARFMNERLAESDFAGTGIVTRIDAEIAPERVSVPLIDALAVLEPYGQGNPGPRFLLRNVRVTKSGLLKDAHVKLEIDAQPEPLEALLFNGAGTPLGEALRESAGRRIDAVVTLKVNEFRRTRRAQAMIEDARWAD